MDTKSTNLPKHSRNAEAALQYRKMGLFPIPLCWSNAIDHCGCGRGHIDKRIGKAPLLSNGYQNLLPTEEDIIAWWTKWPEANIGILVQPSGIAGIDCDSNDAFTEALEKGMPATWSFATGRGQNRIYRLPTGVTGSTTKQGHSKAIDIKASGYMVFPPSIHRNGKEYKGELSAALQELPLLPGWAIDLLKDGVKNKPCGNVRVTLPTDLPTVDIATLPISERIKRIIELGPDAEPGHFPSRSEALHAVEMALIGAGCQDEILASVLLDQSNGISEKPLEQGRNWIAGDIARARAKSAEKSGQETEGTQEPPQTDSAESPRFKQLKTNLHNASELIGKVIPPVQYDIQDILVSGSKTILAGDPSSGKTWTALGMAVSLVTGQPFLGKYKVLRAGPCLIVEEEHNQNNFERRIQQITEGKGFSTDDLKNLHFLTQEFMKVPQDQKHIINLVRELGCKTIIFDSLRRIHTMKENSSDEMQLVLESLSRINKETGINIIMIHHLKKSQGDGGNHRPIPERMRGTGDLWAWRDLIIGLETIRTGEVDVERTKCSFEFRDAPKTESLVIQKTLNRSTDEVTLSVMSLDEAKIRQHQQKDEDKATDILNKLVSAKKALSKNQLYKLVKGKKTAFNASFAILEKLGKVKKEGSKWIPGTETSPGDQDTPPAM